MKYDLLICTVPHNSGEFIATVATEAGAEGGTILMGRGTATNSVLQLLALGDSSKDIVYILVRSEQTAKIVAAVLTATQSRRKGFGVLFTVDSTHVVKNGVLAKGEIHMTYNTTHQMITVIANKGYADDVMAAARNAGAGGGTVINARGTAMPGDEKFFGMEIVSEKEMLVIVVESEKVDAVLEAVRTLACLEKPGSGVAFCCPASNFTLLGKNA